MSDEKKKKRIKKHQLFPGFRISMSAKFRRLVLNWRSVRGSCKRLERLRETRKSLRRLEGVGEDLGEVLDGDFVMPLVRMVVELLDLLLVLLMMLLLRRLSDISENGDGHGDDRDDDGDDDGDDGGEETGDGGEDRDCMKSRKQKLFGRGPGENGEVN